MATGYKLFESKDGILYPLFIDKREPVPIGIWMEAKAIPTKGFAPRPGWHIGEIPDAPWLKCREGYYKSRFARGQRVWCEVEYSTDVDWNELARQSQKGWLTDQLPVNGYYKFKETGSRLWIIAGAMRVVRILTEEERQQIGYDETQAFEPYMIGMEKRMKKKA